MTFEPKTIEAIRHELLRWYDGAHRKLPWRETADPYRIWISEVMLQQTRVAAVIPYYERFLERFPDVATLAGAPEQDLLKQWAGLGYYSRARNLQKAARQMDGIFPRDYDSIRALAGIGDYTAAAVASMAFQLPHACVDGNVVRVITRLTNDSADISAVSTRRRVQQIADALLDPKFPGKFNQALMELGATLCLPKQPQCLLCPLRGQCQGWAAGRQSEIPVKLRKVETVRSVRTLLICCKKRTFLMWRRRDDARMMAGMWELPEPDHLPGASIGALVGSFKHAITNHDYTFRVVTAQVKRKPAEFHWIDAVQMDALPISTTARKALKLAQAAR